VEVRNFEGKIGMAQNKKSMRLFLEAVFDMMSSLFNKER
jgi:hypothetical protein